MKEGVHELTPLLGRQTGQPALNSLVGHPAAGSDLFRLEEGSPLHLPGVRVVLKQADLAAPHHGVGLVVFQQQSHH